MIHRRFLLLLVWLSLVGTVPGHVAMAQNLEAGNGSAVIDTLTNEFEGAFPLNITPEGSIREFELVAAPGTWGIVPPYRTDVWAYNQQIPGPVFRIRLGETVKVQFTNRLPQPTTIHWHGVRVRNAMDGVPGVTQPPVRSGESFTYQFTPKDAGTFWFHPHVNTAEQVERGLQGVLIVEDPDEPHYSRDLVLVLDDWLLGPDGTIRDRFVTRHDLAHDGRWGNVPTVNGRLQPSLSVRAGERVRIRMINVANGRVFAPLFPGLSPQVIAVDGMLTAAPLPLQRFNLAPGNRIDLDLIIPSAAQGTVLPIVDTFTRNRFALAALQVELGPAVETPRFKPPQAAHFPDWGRAADAPLSHEYLFDAVRGGPYGISWRINGQAWPDSTETNLESSRFHRLRLTNESYRLHPIHLHGQFFRLIARDGQPVDERFWRDTILIGPEESVDIGLVPLDKGLWANHCHILEHAEAGMMSVVRVH